jgi:hypothetical protein
MSLQGVLADFGVADIFQLIAQQRKTGVLTIENQERALEVHFREGAVLRARPAETRPDGALAEFLLRTGAISEPDLADAQRRQEETLESLPHVLVEAEAIASHELDRVIRLVSHETIFELFLWDAGAFRFHPRELGSEPGDEPVGAEMVLLDALRMRDEWMQICLRLPDLSATVMPVADAEQFQAKRARVAGACGLSDDDVERLFNLVNRRSSARRVIDLSRLGTFQGAKGLAELARQGLLRFDAAQRPIVQPTVSSMPAVPVLERWAGLAALGLAGVVAALLLVLDPAPAADFPRPTDALQRAQAGAELDRVRVALDSHRWAEAAYPESLRQLEGTPGLAPDLADRYLYARTAAGYKLDVRR